MRKTILTALKSSCDEDIWRTYHEFSKIRDDSNLSVEEAVRENSSGSRSPSPTRQRRSLSAGHNEDIRLSPECKRCRSLPPGFSSRSL
ncbi:unnamed protein product [Gongylonema pulchrum]|uniref:Uncharacterized protein n=1 Tax=Gongylonema pulchrum TaxID=637853 RepID=A0A183F0C0_9BILA|nr:unnamed protein product [Gongylonema pulchrum]